MSDMLYSLSWREKLNHQESKAVSKKLPGCSLVTLSLCGLVFLSHDKLKRIGHSLRSAAVDAQERLRSADARQDLLPTHS